MKTKKISKIFILSVLSLISLFALAKQEKVLQIFKNGEIIKEYSLSDIDYIEVNDLIGAPQDINASVSGNEITISWQKVEGATYNIYRSPDNVNFTLLVSGLDKTTYTDTKPLAGTNYYRVKAIVDGVESGYSTSAVGTLPTGDQENGMYLGIKAFNQKVYDYPIMQLTESSVEGYRKFVNDLTPLNGTLLYYSVDQAITALQTAKLPSDISTAAIVTFTDGLDQGSMMMPGVTYGDNVEYLDAINKRIMTETVGGQPITAFSIGIRGSDVKDTQLFSQNLRKLASSAENATEVTSMSEVNEKFKEIAGKLSQSNYIQTINLTIPGLANGTQVRFSFDNVAKAENSKYYIEGTFNLADRSLQNVKYVGLTSTSGSTVKGKVDGIFVSFTFDGVHTDSNQLIKQEYTDEWTYISSNKTWQINSEFDKTENSDIETKLSSAVVMLVLDCSISLDKDFAKAQANAIDFINTLYKAVGGGDPGNDPGTNPGTDPVGSNTINGHEYVDLGLPSGLKWATCNVGASSPNEYGDYFAWGETQPKSTYVQDNSTTYGKGVPEFSGNPQYDAARANWGGTWRMPAKLEMEELKNKCTWTWTTRQGITGYLVTGPNGNSIFLPSAGYRYGSSLGSAGSHGYYWSSSPDSDSSSAWLLYFYSGNRGMLSDYRYGGPSVRPVTD